MRVLQVLILLLFCDSWSFAQYTVAKVTFNNAGSFSQADLLSASGLKLGDKLSTEGLQAAAGKLVATGYFDDISATVEGKFTAINAIFNLKPTPLATMLPVGFDNLVFLTHDEIEAAIKAKVPLYNGLLPDNSPHQDEIKQALTAALAAKSVSAEVAFDTYEPTLRHPVRTIRFRIAQPAIRVGNIKLGGVTPDLTPLIQRSVNSTARTPYSEGPADETTAERILAPLLDAGYSQAALTGVTLATAAPESGVVPVVLSARLTPGEVYKVTSLNFAGTPVLSADAFNAAARLHPGDIASRKLLLESLLPIDQAYRRLGYMDVSINAGPAFDAVAHQVAYTVTVQPGEQYRIHEVTANNLDPVARADFDRGFLMKQGQLYNPEYVTGFLKNNTALQKLNGYSAGFKAYADPTAHTVDLVITFVKAGR